MDLNYIKEFVILAETGNFLKASDALFISQSSLSKHIRVLEKELEVSLFDRTTRSVKLSDAGIAFLPYAKQIMELQYEYKTALLKLRNNVKQTISIGSIPVMAPYGITNVIVNFKRTNPLFSVNIIEGESADLKQLLRQNLCELAFIREDEIKEDEFSSISFTDDHLCVVLPKNHPLSKRKTIHIEELKNEDFLLLQPDSLVYQLSMNACKAVGFIPNVNFTGKRAENIIDLIEKGMGISLLMRKPIQYLANENIRIVDIIPYIKSEIKLYYLKKAKLSQGAHHFIEHLHVQESTL